MGGWNGRSCERQFLLIRVRAAAACLHLDCLDDDGALGVSKTKALFVCAFKGGAHGLQASDGDL